MYNAKHLDNKRHSMSDELRIAKLHVQQLRDCINDKLTMKQYNAIGYVANNAVWVNKVASVTNSKQIHDWLNQYEAACHTVDVLSKRLAMIVNYQLDTNRSA